MNRIAFYSGSFDPMTYGHLDILKQGVTLADDIFLGIGVHPEKKPLFSFSERVALIEAAIQTQSRIFEKVHIKTIPFSGLVIDAAKEVNAKFILRGVRDGSDFDYEMQMAAMNRQMMPDIITVFLPASASVRPITATLVRQIASLGGDVTDFVPFAVNQALKEKFA